MRRRAVNLESPTRSSGLTATANGRAFWNQILGLLPELYVYGSYDPAKQQGPALWLACIEARVLAPNSPQDRIPVFYLPGIGREQLRDPEDLPIELQPLAAMRFRGAEWVQANGAEWTPASFLESRNGGLDCEVSHDAATTEAILRALPRILLETVDELRHERLDAAFFDGLLSPDTPRLILRWMNDPMKERRDCSKEEWAAFRTQCKRDYGMDPEKDGELRAAELLGKRQRDWKDVWKRFADAPQRYASVATLLERIDPTDRGELAFPPEAWPRVNEREERELAEALKALDGFRVDQAIERTRELEKKHGERRSWVWRELNRAPLACALEHLAVMADCAATPLAGAAIRNLSSKYANKKRCIALLAILMPALHRVREQGQRAVCLNHMKTLTLCWIMYADENDDRIVNGEAYWAPTAAPAAPVLF